MGSNASLWIHKKKHHMKKTKQNTMRGSLQQMCEHSWKHGAAPSFLRQIVSLSKQMSSALSKFSRMHARVRQLGQQTEKYWSFFGLAQLTESLPSTHKGAGTVYAPKACLLAPQLGHVNSHEHSYGHSAGDGHHHIPPVPGKGRGRGRTWGRGVDRDGGGFSHMGLWKVK